MFIDREKKNLILVNQIVTKEKVPLKQVSLQLLKKHIELVL